jgi:hypothetical protein
LQFIKGDTVFQKYIDVFLLQYCNTDVGGQHSSFLCVETMLKIDRIGTIFSGTPVTNSFNRQQHISPCFHRFKVAVHVLLRTGTIADIVLSIFFVDLNNVYLDKAIMKF